MSKYAIPVLSTIGSTACFLSIVFLIHGCMERGQEFKIKCMDGGGTLISTDRESMCIHGTLTRSN